MRAEKKMMRGFSLVELMVAITIGLLVIAGLVTLFVNNSNARNEIERANRQIESGRYAMELLTQDLRNAGYFAEFNPQVLPLPAAVPNPCVVVVNDPDPAIEDLNAVFPLHTQGIDNVTADSTPACLSDVKLGTDILVIRRVATCVAGTVNCDKPVGVPYFQASTCNDANELAAGDKTKHYALDTDLAKLDRHKRDCIKSPPGTLADIHRYRTDIYFVANNNEAGDGVPTLKRAELGAGAFTIARLVEGIDNMQIDFGLDPAAATPADWQAVTNLKLHLLAKNFERTAGFIDDKVYTLGLKPDGAANTVGPFNDAFKRHVFQSSVTLMNPAGRIATK